MKNFIFFMGITLLLCCSPSPKVVEGRYYCLHNLGVEYIDVKDDYTYFHRFKNDTLDVSQTGRWDFSRDRNQLNFNLYDFEDFTSFVEKNIIYDAANRKIYKGVSYMWDGDKIISHDDIEEYNFYKEPTFSELMSKYDLR